MGRKSLAALAAALVAAATNVQIGCNIASTDYYDNDLKYCDLMHMSGTFGVPDGPWKGAAQIDPTTGYPVEDFSVIVVDTNPNLFVDVLKITGYSSQQPKISGVASNLQLLNITYADGAFTAFASVNTTMATVAFTNTGAGVTNVTMRRASCPDDGSVYHPAFVAHLQRCSLLRMMDYLETNGNMLQHWTDRPRPTWPQWAYNGTGAPLEAAIWLANEVNRDIWVNVPISADDDYVTNLAQLLNSTLNPGLNIYVEWSNEVWNWAFSQSHTALTMANVSVTQKGDPYKYNYDNCNNEYYWQYRQTAYNAAVRLPGLFKAVFGPGAVGKDKRIRPVLASQIAYDLPLLEGIDYLTTVYGPLDNMLHSIAGAPYFNVGNDHPLSVDDVLASVTNQINGSYLPNGWNQAHAIGEYATFAAWHRVYLSGYEGGPDFSRGDLNYSVTAGAQRDPRFTGIFQNYLMAWASHGPAERLNHFTAGATDWADQYGNWGLLERIDVPVTTKTQAVDAVIASPTPANALGIVPGTTGFPAGYYAGCGAANISSAGSLKPNPWNGDSGAFFYPLNLAGVSSGRTLSVALHASNSATGSAGLVQLGLNNDKTRFVNVTIPVTPSPSTVTASFPLNADDISSFGGCAALRLLALDDNQVSYSIDTLDVAVA